MIRTADARPVGEDPLILSRNACTSAFLFLSIAIKLDWQSSRNAKSYDKQEVAVVYLEKVLEGDLACVSVGTK